MESPASRIPARSRRQAMDWSLVLVSQGIETIIQNSEDGSGWGLLVPATDLGRATESLRQYHLENRGWQIEIDTQAVEPLQDMQTGKDVEVTILLLKR